MTMDEFEVEVRRLIDRADLSQMAVAVVLQNLADEQESEFDDREE